MLISVYNLKGGVGKSSLAYSIANDLDMWYITNDTMNSIVSNNYDKVLTKMNSQVIKEKSIIFDGGGFFDTSVKDILKSSNYIIIPIEADLNSINSLNNFLPQLQKVNKNILFVFNKIENTKTALKDLEDCKKFIINTFKIDEKDIIRLSHSRIFKNTFEHSKGVNQLINSSKINKYIYRNFSQEYNSLIDRLK